MSAVLEYAERLAASGIGYVRDCPMARYTTFRIGGTAALAVFPRTRAELISALEAARDTETPAAVIGKGSDLLLPDGRFEGALILTSGCDKITVDGTEIEADCGASLAAVALKARLHSLTGMEFAAGIPGTVGGGVLMNAGAFGGTVGGITEQSSYWNRESGTVGSFSVADHQFGTRTSVYAENDRYVILGATLRLTEGERSEIDRRMEDYRDRRQRTQPLEFPNAGSVFRHPVGHFAGKLIEDCGLKGLRVGGAEVSMKHAGFIINRGGATASDVLALVEQIRERVSAETGIHLECELRRLCEDGHIRSV